MYNKESKEKMAGLIKQQYLSLSAVIEIKFITQKHSETLAIDEDLIKLCKKVLNEYNIKTQEIIQLQKSQKTLKGNQDDEHILER